MSPPASRARMGRLGTRDIAAFNRWQCISRLRAAVVVSLFVLVLRALGLGENLRLGPVLAAAGATGAVSAVGFLWWNRLKDSRAFLYVQFASGVVPTTVAIALATHGMTALLARSFYFVMIVPAALLSLPVGLCVTTAATVGHGLILTWHAGASWRTLGSAQFLIPTVMFFMVAQQCFFYGRHLERKNRVLRALARRLRTSQERIAAQGRLSAELAAAGRKLSGTLVTAAPLSGVSRTLRDRLDADWAAVFRVSDGAFSLAAVSEDDAGGDIERLDLPLAAWPPLATLAAARTQVLQGADAAHVPAAFTGGRTLDTVLLAALHRDDVMVGFLAVGFATRPSEIDSWALPLLASLSEHAAIAFVNARLLDEMRQANALKSEFVGAVSHELRSPLNVLLGYQEMLLDHGLGPLTPAQADAIRRSQSHTVVLLEMITALLDLNRFEAGRLPVTREAIPAARLMTQILDELPESWRRPEVELRLAIDGRLPMIETDVGKLKTVIRNLIHNALKFTERGSVTLGASLTADGELAVTVTDTGRGIPADAVPYVFDMFRQVPGTTGGGVGLGLHIVKRFADALGAIVAVRSEVGHGTRFTLTLPRTGALRTPIDASAAAA